MVGVEDSEFRSKLQSFGTEFRRKLLEADSLFNKLKSVSYSERSSDFTVPLPTCFGTGADVRREFGREIQENVLAAQQKRNGELQERLMASETINQHLCQLLHQLSADFENGIRQTLVDETVRITQLAESEKKAEKLEQRLKTNEVTVKEKEEEKKTLTLKVADLEVSLAKSERQHSQLLQEHQSSLKKKDEVEKKLAFTTENLKKMENTLAKLQGDLRQMEHHDRQAQMNIREIQEFTELQKQQHVDALNRLRQELECEFAEQLAEEAARHTDILKEERLVHEKALKASRDQVNELMMYKKKYASLLKESQDAEYRALNKCFGAIDGTKRQMMSEALVRDVLARRENVPAGPNLPGIFLNDHRGSEAGSLDGSIASSAESNRFLPFQPRQVPPTQKRTRSASETRAPKQQKTSVHPQVVFQSRNPTKRPAFK